MIGCNIENSVFAVSDCEYAPGLLCITGDGAITYDPKAMGPESTIKLLSTMGLKKVNFEVMLMELTQKGTEIRGSSRLNPIQQKEIVEMVSRITKVITESRELH